ERSGTRGTSAPTKTPAPEGRRNKAPGGAERNPGTADPRGFNKAPEGRRNRLLLTVPPPLRGSQLPSSLPTPGSQTRPGLYADAPAGAENWPIEGYAPFRAFRGFTGTALLKRSSSDSGRTLAP